MKNDNPEKKIIFLGEKKKKKKAGKPFTEAYLSLHTHLMPRLWLWSVSALCGLPGAPRRLPSALCRLPGVC